MNRHRRFVFLGGAAVLGGVLVAGMSGLQPFGEYPGPYGDALSRAAYYDRLVTNAVTAVNFDLRGLDTLGEDSILFAAVAGSLVLLRQVRAGTAGDRPEHGVGRLVPPTDAITAGALLAVGLLIVYGLELLLHAQLTPGGGFQSGVILATAALLGYLVTDFKSLRRFSPHLLLTLGDALGAAAYSGVGLAALFAGRAFLSNILPLGTRGSLVSGGTIAVINLAVGLEVAAAFTLLFSEFLTETRPAREKNE